MTMCFGKYRGIDVRDVPSSYLEWAIDTVVEMPPSLRAAMLVELRRRAGESTAPIAPSDLEAELVSRVSTWYRDLAREWHPDKRGGSNEGMTAINDARGRLLKALNLEPARH